MPTITPDQLPPDIRDLLGRTAEPHTPISEQPVCTPDSRVTAQAIGDTQPRIRPAYIRNARKGDLIISPGGSEGVIGALLYALKPPQRYSHMGIMTRDYTEIRHATFSEERLKKFPSNFNTPDDGALHPDEGFFPTHLDDDTPPTDGFQESALKFGWPGTITQTVHVCWLNWRYGGFDLSTLDDGGMRILYDDAMENMATKPIEERLIITDPVLGDREDNAFKIGGMTFGAVSMDSEIVYPLVVKPCAKLDAAVRSTLARLADTVRDIRGHYRFFAYTDATIALNPSFAGPPVFELQEPDRTSNCPGARPMIATSSTIPVVCSTLIWAAAARLNAVNSGSDFITLHGVQSDEELARLCDDKRSYYPPTERDTVLTETPNGLYFYTKEQRAAAAAALYKHNRETVANIVLENADLLASLKGEISSSHTVTSLWDLAKLITLLGYPAVRAFLEISDDALARLVTLLSDMPDDVANQLCNAFASDDCSRSAKDSTAWKDDPGLGTTVSPDNIIRSWSLPVEGINGLYGFNERVELVPPTWWASPPPETSWQISQGLRRCTVRVVVASLDSGAPEYGVENAVVRIGGHPAFSSGPDGWVKEVDLPEGVYWCDAHWRHPGLKLTLESEGQRERIALDGATGVILIKLQPPLKTRRRIWFSGQAHLVNRHAGAEIPLVDLVIHDWEKRLNLDHRHRNLADAEMDPFAFGFPDDDPKFASLVAKYRRTTRTISLAIEDWGSAEAEFDLQVQADGSVKVSVKAGMRHGGDTEWTTSSNTDIPVNETRQVQIALKKGIWPARANITLNITNSQI